MRISTKIKHRCRELLVETATQVVRKGRCESPNKSESDEGLTKIFSHTFSLFLRLKHRINKSNPLSHMSARITNR